MIRIDMTSRQLAWLIKPVLPHAVRDKDMPSLGAVRLEVTPESVAAVATDRYSLGAERFQFAPSERPFAGDIPAPVHLDAADLGAALKLFPFSKDDDPMLRVIIDTVPVTIAVVGQTRSVNRLGLTIESEYGNRSVLPDRRDPSSDPLGSWRVQLANARAAAISRTAEIPGLDDLAGAWTAIQALSVNPAMLSKWKEAQRPSERAIFYHGDPVLIAVENHFLGLMKQVAYIEEPAEVLIDSPWAGELGAAGLSLAGRRGRAIQPITVDMNGAGGPRGGDTP